MKKNGFTMIELLGVIVIIGILSSLAIVSVSRLINIAKNSSDDSLANTLKMASQSYMEANKNEMPKAIGEIVDLKAETLRKSNYITSDLKNSKGDSCMAKSHVKVYKRTSTEYVYTPYVCCGNSSCKSEEDKNSPVITINFSGNSSQVRVSSFTVNISGDGESNSKAEIDSYNYIILFKSAESGEYIEAYNSGSVAVKNKKNLTFTKELSEFSDFSGENDFKVVVTAINEFGKKTTKEAFSLFNDNIPPKCSTISGQAKDDNDWINKEEYNNGKGKSRLIKVKCDDPNNGSGCKRFTFSKSWPTNKVKSVSSAKITISDNAGNKTQCPVRVNLDIIGPTAKLNVYSSINDRDRETNKKLRSDINTDDSRTSTTIGTQDYKNSVNKWLNASNYPNGAFYKVVVSDDFLSYWEWKTNTAGLKSADTNVLLSNPDASRGTFKNQKNDIITFGFNKEGYRYGELTIYDKAGNKVTYKIYANLDRTRPGCSSSYTSPNSYNGEWTKSDVGLKGTCSDGMSECERSYISKTISYDINSDVSPGTVSDNAGNTYTCPKKLVKVDKTAPRCYVSGNSNWTNKNVTISGRCDDGAGSGCKSSYVERGFYNNTNGQYSPGSFYDNVGNKVECSSLWVRIDKTKPSCSTKKTNTYSPAGVTVNISCRDDGGSNVKSCPGGGTRKTGKTYYVSDNAGNSSSCSVSVYSETQYRKRTCNTGNRCSAAGCYKYKYCQTRACGYRSCRSSACGYTIVKTASNRAGMGVCNGICRGFDLVFADAPAGGGEGVTCKCGNYRSCATSACGYNSCRNSACGCKTYNSNASICGCYSWNNYNGWSSKSSNYCNSNTCQGQTRTVYY